MNYYSDGVYAQAGIMCRGIVHTIKQGDTLYKLSRIYGVDLECIMDANPDINIYNLQINQKICIPVTPGQKPQQGIAYRVNKGESLNSLLKKFDMTFEEFERFNRQLMPIPLKTNSIVFIPPDKILREGETPEA